MRAEESRSDCLLAVMEAHERLERTDCAVVPEGRWHEECLFLFAERANKAGRLEQAFAACDETSYGRECSYHLIREAARTVRDEPPARAGAAVEPYRALSRAPDAPLLFWKAWYREQAARGRTIDPTGCPDKDCLAGAREIVFQRLNGTFMADPAAWCAWVPKPGEPVDGVQMPPPPPTGKGVPAWVATPEVTGWVWEWSRNNCARVHDPRELPADGPRSVPTGPEPPPPGAMR